MAKLNKLENWFLLNGYGRYILRYERLFFHNSVVRVFGYHALQFNLPNINFMQGNKIPHHFVLNHDIKSEFEFLPFANNCIDLIVLPHILEFANNYHYILQECYRVLIPNGKIIITAFSNKSPFKYFLKRSPIFKNAKFISLEILKAQLQALNFHIDGGRFFAYVPPMGNHDMIARLSFMDKIGNRWLPTFSNAFAITATKELYNMHLIHKKATLKLEDSKLSPQLG